MKLKNGIVVLVYLLGMNNLQAHKIDPIEDFKYPESLFQVVHEGIVHIMYMIRNHGNDQNIMQQISNSLHEVQDQCDVVMRYNPNPIKSEEDREFLSSMIDNLESLVDSLQDDQKIRTEVQDICEYVRMKIMQSKY